MKVCPSCKTQYTDDSLLYCLQDGTRLTPLAPAPVGTAETETVVRHREPGLGDSAQSSVTRVAQPDSGRRSKATIIIAGLLIALVAAAIVLALGITWLVWHPTPASNNTLVANDRNINQPVNTYRPSPSVQPSPVQSSSISIALPTPTPTPRTNTDNVNASRDVEATVERWRNSINVLDIDLLMQEYAGTVDYYRRGPVSAAFVRKDKERAFDTFTLITVSLSNMNISIDPSGDVAKAEFDKLSVFQNARTTKVNTRSQLRLARINGRWLITGERDLSVYYKK